MCVTVPTQNLELGFCRLRCSIEKVFVRKRGVVRFVVDNIVYQYCFHTFHSFMKTIFPQLKSLLKTLHLLVKRHKYKDFILVTLILVALQK